MKSKLLKTLGVFCLLLTATFSNAQPILSFDGVNDWVNLGNAGDNIRTFEMWFSPTGNITDGTASRQTLIARETSGANNREEFDLYWWTGTGNLQFLYRENVSPFTLHQIQSNSNSWTANQWYHVAVVIHPTNGVTMFIDGILQTSSDPTWTSPTIAIPGTMLDDYTAIGRWGDFTGRYFNGRIEDVRLSGNALYSANFTPPCPTLGLDASTTGLWNFNTGSGGTAFDSSPSGFDGIITGATWGTDVICDGSEQCECNALFDLIAGPISTSGNQTVSLTIDTQGEAVTSICIELPYYLSLVDPACLACDTDNLGANGTFLSGTTLAGSPGILDDPYGLGYARKICYEFAVPTIVNGTIDLDLKFPAVIENCKNSVRYCLDVEIRKDDCTVCEYEVCPKEGEQRSSNPAMEDQGQIITSSEAAFTVFPNPTIGNITIQIKDENFESGEVKLTSLDGKTVQTKFVNSSRFEMNLNSVNSGTYLLIVQTGNKTTSQRVVVN